MKPTYILIGLMVIISSCQSKDSINGLWKTHDAFYRATYRIYDQKESKVAKIISYNDGTTQYTSQTRPNQFLFNNLIKNNEHYIDAVTGATKTQISKTSNTIQMIHQDTLEVTTFLFGKPLKELWTRTIK